MAEPAYRQDSVAFHFTWRPDTAAVLPVVPLVERQLARSARARTGARSSPSRRTNSADRYDRLPDFVDLARHYDPRASSATPTPPATGPLAMSPQGTAAYDGLTDLPPLVERAVGLARPVGFANSCRPEHGRLLHALAAGAGTIGETGTGCGVGLAWLASGARPGTRLVSVEIDAERAGLVAALSPTCPRWW